MENRLYHSARPDRTDAHKQASQKGNPAAGGKTQQNPEDSGGYKFTKDTFYSHSINKDPSQKKTIV